jgi:hypothetical protein
MEEIKKIQYEETIYKIKRKIRIKNTLIFNNKNKITTQFDINKNKKDNEYFLAYTELERQERAEIKIGENYENKKGKIKIMKIKFDEKGEKFLEEECHEVLSIYHNHGVLVDMKWCPFFDNHEYLNDNIGLICFVFSDGTISIFSISKSLLNQKVFC